MTKGYIWRYFMGDIKEAAIHVIEKLPDNKLTQPLKGKIEKQLIDELRAAEQDVQRSNWQLTMFLEKLKQMLVDPNLPDSQKAELQKKEQEIADKLQDIQTRLQCLRDKQN